MGPRRGAAVTWRTNMRAPALAVLALVAVLSPAPARAADDLASQLDAVLAPLFPADQPGAAVLVKKGDQVLLRKGYGMADLEQAIPMRPEAVFRIGSITKQLTAAGIVLLADERKLSLQDDVRKHLPQLPDRGAKITIEHLLTHTSGIPSYTDQPSFRKRSREDLSHDELLGLIKDVPLDFQPGQRWKYSNSGYYLLGMVIEKVSAKSYREFMEERVFRPLGMRNTTYGDDDRVIPGRIRGYQRPGGPAPGARARNADLMSMKPPFAAGALVSTVDDLAVWDAAITAGKLLKPQSWARVFTAAKLKDGSATTYGHGWALGAYQGSPTQAHGGGIPGFNTEILRLPRERVVVVILCNVIPAPAPLGPLTRRLAGLAIGKPMVEPKVAQIDPALLDRYAGVYKLKGSDRRVVIGRGPDHLTVKPSWAPQAIAHPEADTRFFIKEPPIRLGFAVDPKTRKVTRLDVTKPDGNIDLFLPTDEPPPAEKPTVTVDATTLDRYVGAYELRPGFVLTVSREGTRLFTQATGQPRFEVFATAPTEFIVKAFEARLTFDGGGSAAATKVTLFQNGQEVVGRRMP